QLLAGLALIMLALYAFSFWQLGRLDEEYASLQAQERGLVARVTELSQTNRARPESRELRAAVESARRERDMKLRLLELMQDRPQGTAMGFSAAFAGLARQRVDGLWLTGVEISRDGATQELTLHGMTARADLVPQLVQRLGVEPAFQGLRFRHLRVFRPDGDDSDALAFELSTRPSEPAP